MKQRTFHYIKNPDISKVASDNNNHLKYTYQFDIQSYEIESVDTFEDELILLALPIDSLQNVDNLLYHFGLNDNSYYFFKQCKDLVAVPEKHTDEEGKGSSDLQAYFHNIPYSFMSINETALVIVALHPLKGKDTNGLKDYNLIGYIHCNELPARNDKGEIQPIYYYNMLRISTKTVNNEKIYRRKRLFMMLFAIYDRVVDINGIDFIYASMGRENKAINDGLNKSTTAHGHYYHRIPYNMYIHANKVFGKKGYVKKLIDITNDPQKIEQFYNVVHESMKNYMFYNHHSLEVFKGFVSKITSYSKSSRIYVLEENGKIKAGTFAVNWGDYFSMELEEANGLLKIVERMELTNRILYPILNYGQPEYFRKLIKGVASIYLKKYGCKITLLPSYKGDPLDKVKKSIMKDETYYFMIARNKERLEQLMERSKDNNGNVRIFTDQPML